jgi:carboxyl-terminal processing protease
MRREVVREIIRVQTVKWRLLEGGTLYVRLSAFHDRTLENFREALQAGRDAAAASLGGVILDLRGNPGGLFQSCIGVSAAFLPETAVVVETKGRNQGSNRRYFARSSDYERSAAYASRSKPLPAEVRDVPLVVLVSRRSAACSEIVAAAMQDHKRASVIGEKTFGLGTIQTILPLGASSALRLTTARFYRPAGEAIEEKGVTPDVAVALPERFRGYGEAGDPALAAALKALQK